MFIYLSVCPCIMYACMYVCMYVRMHVFVHYVTNLNQKEYECKSACVGELG